MAYTDLSKRRASSLRWYYKNKDKILLYKQQSRKARIEYIKQLKDKPCQDCGVKYPHYVMDFDHRNGTSKLDTINRLTSTHYGLRIIEAEMKKCDLVCANCHRIRTYKNRLLLSPTPIKI